MKNTGLFLYILVFIFKIYRIYSLVLKNLDISTFSFDNGLDHAFCWGPALSKPKRDIANFRKIMLIMTVHYFWG